MADRITQLQDAVNQQADNMCNSIGVIQQFAKPSPITIGGVSKPAANVSQGQNSTTPPQQDYPVLFAQLIARTAKDIDVLIDSLPSEDSSPELQVAALRRLQAENQEAAQGLRDSVAKGETLLEKIQNILSEIANSQLKAQRTQHLRAAEGGGGGGGGGVAGGVACNVNATSTRTLTTTAAAVLGTTTTTSTTASANAGEAEEATR